MDPTTKNLFILLTMWVSPATLLLLVISLYLVQPKVEAKLASHVKSILTEHNIAANVSFSGRDGILTGNVASQEMAENAHKLSLAVFGTRIIKNRLVVNHSQYNKTAVSIDPPHIKKASYIPQSVNSLQKAVYQTSTTKNIKNKLSNFSEIDKIMLEMSRHTLIVPAYKPKKTRVSQPVATPIVAIKKVKPIAYPNKVTLTPQTRNDRKKRKPKPKQRHNKITPTLAVKISKALSSAVKKKEKKKTVISHSAKGTNDLFLIIDDFNVSLDEITKKTSSSNR